MMNQRTIRTGRARGLSVIALPEILASVTMFMSCTFCSYRLLPRIRRHFAIQMRDDSGFVESNSAENEFANLPLEIGSVAVGKAWNRWQPRQRRHQHGVMGKPEQVERIACDPGCLPCRHGLLQRCGEHRPDQIPDLLLNQPGEFPAVELAGDHQPETLGLLLVGSIGDLLE